MFAIPQTDVGHRSHTGVLWNVGYNSYPLSGLLHRHVHRHFSLLLFVAIDHFFEYGRRVRYVGADDVFVPPEAVAGQNDADRDDDRDHNGHHSQRPVFGAVRYSLTPVSSYVSAGEYIRPGSVSQFI